jgi:hypothetical protein
VTRAIKTIQQDYSKRLDTFYQRLGNFHYSETGDRWNAFAIPFGEGLQDSASALRTLSKALDQAASLVMRLDPDESADDADSLGDGVDKVQKLLGKEIR